MMRPWARPLRVALFTDTYDEISGVGHTFRRLTDWAQQHGEQLEVFCVSPAASSREQRGSVTIHRLKPRIPLNYYPDLYFDLLPLDDQVLAYAQQQPFDVIHVATPGHLGLTGMYLAAKLSRPLLGSYHTELPKYVSQRLTGYLDPSFREDPEACEYVAEVSSALTWDYLACFYNHCQRVLVPSEYTRQQVAEHLRPPLALFRRGVDPLLFTPARRARPADAPLRLLYVGRLAVEKNLDWLQQVALRHPAWELVLVGDGPERERLAAALPQARCAGFLRDEALAQEYADADLFAFPSLTETFGNVVLEAQASGLPAVVGDRGGPAEIIEPGRTGLVAGSAEQFEAHLVALAADPQRRRQFAAAARARAVQQSWDDIFSGLWGQYRQLRYPWRRTAWRRLLVQLRDSEHPLAVGLLAFWKQFGRRRQAAAARRAPLVTSRRQPAVPEDLP
ncbi:MAG: glycosyltransferase family 1 protein [Fimbriimonadaceae bacterium]|nr:glycosyltransferase family 1 protein [Fimbriimonadaceae bacterium]